MLIKGIVVHGKGLGRTVGMPTANIEAPSAELPKEGVYASSCTVRGKRYLSVTNIGLRPSVDTSTNVTIETHILDFDEDIYGESISIDLLYFLRPTIKMESLEKVKEQVERDKKEARHLLANAM